MRFLIRPLSDKPEKEGDVFIRYTGNSEPFARGDEMANTQVGVNADKSPIVKFRTGLDEDQIKFYGWFTNEEKEEYKKFLVDNKPTLEQYYGGASVLDSKNSYFWRDTAEINRLIITNETSSIVYDTNKNPKDLMLYCNIVGGAFLEVVAPTKKMAEDRQIPHYIVLENDLQDYVAEDYSLKGDAYALLKELTSAEGDALLFLGWCLQSNSKGFGAFGRGTSKSELLKYSAEFIEGKLTTKKRNCPKDFITYAEKWKSGGLTREAVMVEAYVKAAEYYSLINTNKENKYELLTNGMVLGSTIADAVTTLRKPKNVKELEYVRTEVENKWKE